MARTGLLVTAIAVTAFSSGIHSAESFHADESWFEPYEPTKIARTSDSDDNAFLDAEISIKYPLRWVTRKLLPDEGPGHIVHDPFIAFTGRFGFYWLGGRASSPVVGKRFNPVFGWRFLHREDTGAVACPKGEKDKEQQTGEAPNTAQQFVPAPAMGNRSGECAPVLKESYLQLAYAHESNGQTITTPEEYQAARDAATARNEDPESANDGISRGWDYIGLTWKPRACGSCESARYLMSNYVNLRYFLKDGLLQGDAEEWYAWEAFTAEGKPRARVNGIEVMSKLQVHTCVDKDGRACDRWLGDLKFVLSYETGHEKPFKYHTLRAEAGAHLLGFPVTLWWQKGYANDLALYFRKGTSFGVGLDIGSF